MTTTMYWTQGLHRSVQQQPDEPATIFGDRTRTFAEQADRVARLAGALRDLGVRDGARVGILGLNSDRYTEVLLAIAWADGIFNVLDTMRSPAEMAPMLAESETRVLFVDDTFAAAAPMIREAYPGLRTVVHMGEGPTPFDMPGFEDLIAASAPVADARRGGDATAGLVHTGGTTGLPKTVMHSHRSMINIVLGLGASIPDFVSPGTRLLQLTPMSHISGVGSSLAMSQFGRTFVPMPRFEPAAVLEHVDRHRITAMFIVPTMLQLVIDHPEAASHDLSSLRQVFYGASPMTESVLERSMAALPGVAFAQLYAMSEAMSPTILTGDDHRPGPQRASAGRASVISEVRVVDAEDDDVAPGVEGEILLRGAGDMQGYWDDPVATDHIRRGGWTHTGDVGRLDEDGYLYVVDRLKDMIIVDGDNVHSAEVENALSSHPDVATCAVIGMPDGETGEKVHAVVVLHPGAEPDEERLRKHCASLVSGFKVPAGWEFVEALPTTPTGKVLKRSLRESHWRDRERQIN
ncbi:acyl-CoA synthetase (AMP-forming)/AMP-acid ligase II [Nocardioides albertanoniae]|uniref:Acyl-CoA synthetase (AMP-forming)/AMP-acid ligase II n=1 Tax=Nocardioides albertanoniae TaxID=1175486 RepID=A0A543A865_9ACTN|nr:AMP-binding protein [Nocardioides albertanoniae]TQL68792.1 acyl-CoA synthetase (AMP-forming)/AMP-acid ligase II [Nocardioides albertanoniae]